MRVLVRLKAGVLDVQGKAVEHGVTEMGMRDVTNVRVGKLIEFDIGEATFDQAKGRVEQLCQKLLANTIIETYEIIPG